MDEEYWQKIETKEEAMHKIISGAIDDASFTRDNNDDLEVLSELEIKPEMTVLDFGCGMGRLIKPLTEKYPETNFIGVDLSNKNIELAKEYAPKGFYLQSQGMDVPVPNNSIDIIYSALVLQHIHKSKVMVILDQMKTKLKESGQVFLQFPNLITSNDVLFYVMQDVNKTEGMVRMEFYTKEEIEHRMKLIGFKDIFVFLDKRGRLWGWAKK